MHRCAPHRCTILSASRDREGDFVAVDPHKWLHTPFEAGCALIRDRAAHRSAFALTAEYLETSRRDVAAAEWLQDYGLRNLARIPRPQDLDVAEEQGVQVVALAGC